MIQGQSPYTWFKQYRFSPIFAQSLRISQAESVKRFAYYHLDVNAGSGYNDDMRVAGSPLNFLSAVERTKRNNFYAFFVDENRNRIGELVTRPQVEAMSDRVSAFHADNAEVPAVVDAFIRRREHRPDYAVGSLVIDPNGYHNGVPWDALREFCAMHPRIDVVMNLGTRSFRMEKYWIGRKPGKWMTYTLHPISSFKEWFSRPHWMVTEECRISKNSWVQLVGRTMETHKPDYRSLGFYDADSDRGRRIVAGIENDSARTGVESPFLPDL